uniref:Uncharacterized protein n=1 Tax=Anguilla anguilla TaxID=7936 RepID=A0A0E9RW11_ANGAN
MGKVSVVFHGIVIPISPMTFAVLTLTGYTWSPQGLVELI